MSTKIKLHKHDFVLVPPQIITANANIPDSDRFGTRQLLNGFEPL